MCTNTNQTGRTNTTLNTYGYDQGKQGNANGKSRNGHKANETSEKCEVQIAKMQGANVESQIRYFRANANKRKTNEM